MLTPKELQKTADELLRLARESNDIRTKLALIEMGNCQGPRSDRARHAARARRRGDRMRYCAGVFAAMHESVLGHETDVLCVPTNVCSWWKSGHAADITAKTDFDALRTLQARGNP
jgi:hypothetical protein